MKVVEIFNSIEGEGSRAGYLCTFIRLYGCNLRCTYCDSMYANEGSDYTELSVNEILHTVQGYMCNKITLTGGEPLIHKDVATLLENLLKDNYFVNIETNGSIDLTNYYNKFKTYIDLGKLMFTVDWKSLSSGMSSSMNQANLLLLTNKDVLKFVVGSGQDLDQMKNLINSNNLNCQVFVSPIFGDIEPKEIVEYLQFNKLNSVRVQLQLHKFIWPVTMRGV